MVSHTHTLMQMKICEIFSLEHFLEPLGDYLVMPGHSLNRQRKA